MSTACCPQQPRSAPVDSRPWLTVQSWSISVHLVLGRFLFLLPCFSQCHCPSEGQCLLTTRPKWDSCRLVLFASQVELALSPARGSFWRPRRPQGSPPRTRFGGTRRLPVGLLHCPPLASVLVTGNLRVWLTSASVPSDTALLLVTFPDPRIAALPSLSLLVISRLSLPSNR